MEKSPFQSGHGVPSINGILETALYVDNLEAARTFYCEVLGLAQIRDIPGRQLVFRSLQSILLIFQPDATLHQRVNINGGDIPLHGAHGAGHTAFRIADLDLAHWRAHLQQHHVSIESEISWPTGAHSIYFRDPAGNSLELATPGIWD